MKPNCKHKNKDKTINYNGEHIEVCSKCFSKIKTVTERVRKSRKAKIEIPHAYQYYGLSKIKDSKVKQSTIKILKKYSGAQVVIRGKNTHYKQIMAATINELRDKRGYSGIMISMQEVLSQILNKNKGDSEMSLVKEYDIVCITGCDYVDYKIPYVINFLKNALSTSFDRGGILLLGLEEAKKEIESYVHDDESYFYMKL